MDESAQDSVSLVNDLPERWSDSMLIGPRPEYLDHGNFQSLSDISTSASRLSPVTMRRTVPVPGFALAFIVPTGLESGDSAHTRLRPLRARGWTARRSMMFSGCDGLTLVL